MPDKDESAGAARPQYSALGLGERLRSARKARAMSVSQAAQALKLEESTILALEEGRFETLGAAVFIRGHLKRYAQLVGLSIEVVLEAYQASIPASAELPALTRPRLASEQVNLRMWGIWVVVPLLLVVLIALVIRDRGGSPQPAGPTEPAATATEETPALPTPELIGGDGGAADGSAVPAAAAVEPAVTGARAPDGAAGSPAGLGAPVAPAVVRTRLQLRFADDSFVSVTDAEHRLLYGLQRKGSRQELSGRPPLRIVLGNARSVSVSVDGKPFRIPSNSVADNEARFEIGAAADPAADARSE